MLTLWAIRVTLVLLLGMSSAHMGLAETLFLAPWNDSSKDDRERINTALAVLAANGGGTLVLKTGDYYVGPQGGGVPTSAGQLSVKIPSNCELHLSEGPVIHRRIIGGGAMHATIRNENMGSGGGDENIALTGPGIVTAAEGMDGHQVCFGAVEGLRVERVKWRGIDTGFNCYVRDCLNVVLTELDIDSGDTQLEDAIHIAGGSGLVSDCRIRTGDDCIALLWENYQDFAPATATTGWTVTNIWGRSEESYLIKIVCGAGGTPQD